MDIKILVKEATLRVRGNKLEAVLEGIDINEIIQEISEDKILELIGAYKAADYFGFSDEID